MPFHLVSSPSVINNTIRSSYCEVLVVIVSCKSLLISNSEVSINHLQLSCRTFSNLLELLKHNTLLYLVNNFSWSLIVRSSSLFLYIVLIIALIDVLDLNGLSFSTQQTICVKYFKLRYINIHPYH